MWLALGSIVIGLLNVAKFIVRSSQRSTRTTVSPAGMPIASGDNDGGQKIERLVGYGPPGQPAAAVLPPPVARRSA